MHHDDKPVGRILKRREVLALIGGMSTASLAAFAFRSANAKTIYLPVINNGDAQPHGHYSARLRGQPGADRGSLLR